MNAKVSPVLDRAQCLALLTTVPIGRVVYTDRALPAVMPVSFVLDGDHVAFRVRAGSRLAVALHDAVVTFEVDDFDPANLAGWSVTVTGAARAVTSSAEAVRMARLPFRSWPPVANARFVRIPTQHISGGRLAGTGPRPLRSTP
jgi:nitroimidazol reductase NimA-like FMN-containing flavoprotein (pyridoxamine 5'-phosphate oxidase superfamily)